jgi:hypothetical protein
MCWKKDVPLQHIALPCIATTEPHPASPKKKKCAKAAPKSGGFVEHYRKSALIWFFFRSFQLSSSSCTEGIHTKQKWNMEN